VDIGHAESGLSFLDLASKTRRQSGGNMLSFANSYMFSYPWMPLVPAFPILVCSLAINYIGDGLRDALDPVSKPKFAAPNVMPN
jgi:peptide/nickel transport system permease protein